MKRIDSLLIMQQSRRRIFSSQDLRSILNIRNDNTLYKATEGLLKSGVIKKIAKGKYYLSINKPDELQIANFLYSPSYISFESALNFYGILIQASYPITSATPLRAFHTTVDEREFNYSHLGPKLYFGYVKKNEVFIASPEKALADELYLVSKGIKDIDTAELDLKMINKKIFSSVIKKFGYEPLNNLIKRIKL
jgi:predicted transcriptional regulator of viral defense system